MSAGGKAGLALGVLLAIGGILALVLFCYRRKRKHDKTYEKTDDEKGAFSSQQPMVFGGAGRPPSTGTTRTSATAPRLSLRPLTQFSPDIGAKRKSGNLLAAASTPSNEVAQPPAAHVTNDSPRQAASPQTSPGASSNPFGDHAQSSPPVLQAISSPPGSIAPPHLTADVAPNSAQTLIPKDAAVAAGTIAGVGALASMQNAPKPLSINSNHHTSTAPAPSPAGTEFSMTSMTPVAAAVAAATPSPNGQVHRVQLDFRPSMDDELELRAGQLVRLLHEYDDGWVSTIQISGMSSTKVYDRLFVFASIGLNKVSLLVHVSPLVRSNHAQQEPARLVGLQSCPRLFQVRPTRCLRLVVVTRQVPVIIIDRLVQCLQDPSPINPAP